MAEVDIPDDAWTKLREAAGSVSRDWMHTPNRDAYVGQAIGQAATFAVRDAAPLIVAAELERLADSLATPAAIKPDSEEEAAFERGRAEVLEVLRVRAYVVRSKS